MSDSADKAEADPREGRTQRQITWIALALIGLVAGFGIVLTAQLSSPDGVYYFRSSSNLIFTNGQVLGLPEVVSSPPIGSLYVYNKENGQWACYALTRTGQKVQAGVVTATPLGISWHNPNSEQKELFLIRRNFVWIPKTKEWLQAHGLWKKD